MFKRRLYVLIISFVSIGILFQFTNCSAPAASSSSPSQHSDSEVRLVDDLIANKVAFAEQEVVLHTASAQVDLAGLCSREMVGQSIEWDLGGLRGSANCARGGFVIEISNAQAIPCDQQMVLHAVGGPGFQDDVQVTRKCEPLASQVVMDSPQSSERCDLELSQDPSGHRSCNYSCYKDQRLVSSDIIPVDQCPGI